MRGMDAQSASSGNRSKGLHKGRASLFVILVAIGVLCVCALIYMLFYERSRSSTTIRGTGHSLVREAAPPVAIHPAVRS
jgi:hypothetical protein